MGLPIIFYDRISPNNQSGLILFRQITTTSKLCNLVHPNNIAKTLKCAFKSRPESRRHVIWMLIFCFAAIDLLRSSERKVDTQYLR